jgi:hypothetical protein
MFMHAILPQERLQVLIDNSVNTIDILDGHALQRQTMRLKEQDSEAVQNLGPHPAESHTGPLPHFTLGRSDSRGGNGSPEQRGRLKTKC